MYFFPSDAPSVGTKRDDGQSVALKFVEKHNRFISDREFQMYGYLNAIEDGEMVDKFGISKLHYYQEWKGYMLTVLSLFDGGDLDDLNRYFDYKNANLAVNSLLLFRDFVSISAMILDVSASHRN